MDDIPDLAHRADALRERFAAFLDDIGEFAPAFRQLRAELAEIDEHLEALSSGEAAR